MNGEDKIKQSKQDAYAEKLLEGMRSLPVKQLLCCPVASCVKAQQRMAETSLDSLMEQAFKKEHSRKQYEAEFFSFSYVQDGVEKRINVPLLLLLPYQALEITEANFSFSGNLYCTEGELITDARRTQKSVTKSGSSENVRINFNVKAAPSGMTNGLAKLIQFCTESVEAKAYKEETPSELPRWTWPSISSYPSSSFSSMGSGASSGGGLNLGGIIDSINRPHTPSSYGSYRSYRGSYDSSFGGYLSSHASSGYRSSSFGRKKPGRYSSMPHYRGSGYWRRPASVKVVRISSYLWLVIRGIGSYSNGLSLEGILHSIDRNWIPSKRYGRVVSRGSRPRNPKVKQRKKK